MAKKVKIKKTLVEQILSKAAIPHQGIQINALEGELPQGYERDQIFKTLALLGDKTGPIIGIVPITQHLSEKKLAKISGNKKVSMIPQKDLEKTTGYIHEPIILSEFVRNTIIPFLSIKLLRFGSNDCLCRRSRTQHYRRATRLG